MKIGLPESTISHRARLKPILDHLHSMNHSVFLDLCELLSMFSESVNGSVGWSNERVTVRIKRRAKEPKK